MEKRIKNLEHAVPFEVARKVEYDPGKPDPGTGVRRGYHPVCL